MELEYSISFNEKRLISIQNKADLIVAIERTGPTKDGSYRTMSGKDMSHLVAPLELLITKDILLFSNINLYLLRFYYTASARAY